MQNPLEHQSAAPVEASQPKLTPLMDGLVKLLRGRQHTAWQGPKIHIPEIAAGAYFIYEQMRNAVEYREQHLFVRGAIERFLLRELGPDNAEGIGFDLVTELTKTRYLENDATPEDEVAYLDYIVGRYGAMQQIALQQPKADRDAIAEQVVQLLSVELERTLLPNPTEAAIVEFTFAAFIEHADVAPEDHLALYAAVHKALLKSDLATIRYGVFSRTFPHWLEDDEQLVRAGQNFSRTMEELAGQMQGPGTQRMFRLVRRHIAPYLILRELIKSSPQGLEQLANNPSSLVEHTRNVAEQQYQIVSQRLKRSIIQAVIFLFITKMVLGILVEVPYEMFTYGEVDYLPLAINLLFPPLYMAMVGLTIKVPGQRNTDRILSDLKRIVYAGETPIKYSLKPRARASKFRSAFSFFYGLTSLATLAGVAWALNSVGFNIVSGIIFFVFLSTVSFFAYRIAYSVREYAVIEEDPGFLAALTDFLLTPFIRVGQWLAEKYSKINIFTTILDIIIETPFKTILRIIEQWNAFLREKRDDVLR